MFLVFVFVFCFCFVFCVCGGQGIYSVSRKETNLVDFLLTIRRSSCDIFKVKRHKTTIYRHCLSNAHLISHLSKSSTTIWSFVWFLFTTFLTVSRASSVTEENLSAWSRQKTRNSTVNEDWKKDLRRRSWKKETRRRNPVWTKEWRWRREFTKEAKLWSILAWNGNDYINILV